MKIDKLSARVLPYGNSRSGSAMWLFVDRFVPCFVRVVAMTALAIGGAQSQAWAGVESYGQFLDAPLEQTIRVRSTTACGEISYDTQGGSLVINRGHEVKPVAQDLAADLLAKASEGPFNACLVGDWLGNDDDRFFQARGWGLE